MFWPKLFDHRWLRYSGPLVERLTSFVSKEALVAELKDTLSDHVVHGLSPEFLRQEFESAIRVLEDLEAPTKVTYNELRQGVEDALKHLESLAVSPTHVSWLPAQDS